MKAFKYLLAAGLLAVSVTLAAQNSDEKPYLSKSFPAAGFKNLKVETSGGYINVTGQNGSEARIEMYVRGNNGRDDLSGDEIKERLEKYYEVNINKDATTLTATAKRIDRNSDWKNGLSISFKVYVPGSITSDLRTSGGNVTLANLNGQQKAVTSGGNIDVNNTKGNVNVRTSGGNIDIETFNGTMDAATSGGNIEAEEARGGLRLKTSGGNIELASVSGDLDASTSGGNIDADITDLGERISLSTSGGSIKANMPMDKGMDLDLRGSKVKVAMNNFNGVVEDDRVQGKLNGGGIPVHMSTSAGTVQIN
jgi:hypothetical protein